MLGLQTGRLLFARLPELRLEGAPQNFVPSPEAGSRGGICTSIAATALDHVRLDLLQMEDSARSLEAVQ
jgi:hypothetical protein